mmetsp:Transcript_43598/g.100489  ORF Transcript_43598/g.100489 Transcript_43598/m.100489 type:complete len:283 (+) Transcript_43598:1044-1892(+)
MSPHTSRARSGHCAKAMDLELPAVGMIAALLLLKELVFTQGSGVLSRRLFDTRISCKSKHRLVRPSLCLSLCTLNALSSAGLCALRHGDLVPTSRSGRPPESCDQVEYSRGVLASCKCMPRGPGLPLLLCKPPALQRISSSCSSSDLLSAASNIVLSSKHCLELVHLDLGKDGSGPSFIQGGLPMDSSRKTSANRRSTSSSSAMLSDKFCKESIVSNPARSMTMAISANSTCLNPNDRPMRVMNLSTRGFGLELPSKELLEPTALLEALACGALTLLSTLAW